MFKSTKRGGKEFCFCEVFDLLGSVGVGRTGTNELFDLGCMLGLLVCW